MEVVLALEYDAVLTHPLHADATAAMALIDLNLDLLGRQHKQQAGADLGSELLQEIIPGQQRVGDADEDEVGANPEEHELVEEDRLAPAVDDQLHDHPGAKPPLGHQDTH